MCVCVCVCKCVSVCMCVCVCKCVCACVCVCVVQLVFKNAYLLGEAISGRHQKISSANAEDHQHQRGGETDSSVVAYSVFGRVVV